jgi:cobalt-zinc-cadmium efflux system membrane fusion protein
MTRSSIFIGLIAAIVIGAVGYRTLGGPPIREPALQGEKKDTKAENEHVEPDEHAADRILISDVKLAAAGVVLTEAGAVSLSDTLQFNGLLRANQEAVVQVTPRFPGIVRSVSASVTRRPRTSHWHQSKATRASRSTNSRRRSAAP